MDKNTTFSYTPEIKPSIRTFISYSRKNADFAFKLADALKKQKVEVLIDQADIATFEDWWDRIIQLIGQAETIVFVLSPEWLASNVCQRELQLALELKKRIAPVLLKPIETDKAPASLTRLNWINFTAEDSLHTEIEKLVAAFQTDIEWVREHTRLSELARYWNRDGRVEGALLHDDALFSAEKWLNTRPNSAPLPSDLLSEYLSLSRQVHEREEKARRLLLNKTLISQSRMLGEQAGKLIDSGDVATGVLLCLEALPDPSKEFQRPSIKAVEVTCFNGLLQLRESLVIDAADPLHDAAISRDGKKLFALTHKGLQICDIFSGKSLKTIEGEQFIIGSNGARLAVLGKDLYTIWSLETPGTDPLRVAQIEKGKPAALVDLLKDTHAWISYENGTLGSQLQWIALGTSGKEVSAYEKEPDLKESYNSYAFSPDGKKLVTTPAFTFSFPTTVSTWAAETGQLTAQLVGNEIYVRYAEWNKEGTLVATAADDHTARVWNGDTGALLHVFKGHTQGVTCARFSQDGSMLITASFDGSFRIWDIASGNQLAVLRGHLGNIPNTTDIFKPFIPAASFSPDGKWAATIWMDQTIRLWELEPNRLCTVLSDHKSGLNGVSFAPDGKHFATASDDGSILIWDTLSCRQVAPSIQESEGIMDLAYSPDGTTLAYAVGSKLVLWDVDSKKELKRISTSKISNKISFSPDGKRLGICDLDSVEVWDLESEKLVCKFAEGFTGYNMVFSPSGLVAMSCGDERAIRFWNAETGEELFYVILQGNSVESVAFDQTGKRAVLGSYDMTARIWETGQEPTDDNIVILSGHSQAVLSAIFSPAGSEVLTASEDGTAKLWDSHTGALLATLSGHSDRVRKAVFSPDGSRIVTISVDKTIRVWQFFTDTGSLVQFARQQAPRALTDIQRQEYFLDTEQPSWVAELNKWPFRKELTRSFSI